MTDITAFRVRKREARATLTLVNGRTARGAFFLSETAADHAGTERIDEVLNASMRFVPFHVDADTGRSSVILLNRAHILMVSLPSSEAELVHDSSYEIARREPARLVLSNGERLVGEVHIAGPDNARLSDFTNLHTFLPVERPKQTVLVNFDHVVELEPQQGQSDG